MGMAVKKKSGKTAAKKTTAAAKRKAPAIQKKFTKTEILNEISANTDVSKKEVAAVLDELAVLIERHITTETTTETDHTCHTRTAQRTTLRTTLTGRTLDTATAQATDRV